ncbi:hypothetical protein K7T73_04345 [Bacillus badius]|uniref:hypothetical protein n=1 Tax=Bacillus badius TaxID=1455 RepID=UPI001CBE9403|nr:hypothetical protein [Bacillus badius]UAT31469.1 hypothetical protein K7T73_04345 [Bacillus badius]
MLIHYTTDIRSAKSIIESKELWLKSVGKTKDENEIYHYMNEFNKFHFQKERLGILKRILNKETDTRAKSEIEQLNINLEMWKRKINNGTELSNILRNYSYLICFTEEENSQFHDSFYGKISFEFTKNPLGNNHLTHYFLEDKVRYFDAHQLNNIKAQDCEQMAFLTSLTTKMTKKLIKKTNTYYKNYEAILTENINKWLGDYESIRKPDPDLVDTVIFISDLMERNRIEKRVDYYCEIGLVDNEQKKGYEMLLNLERNSKEAQNTTLINLLSLFLKDNQFSNDKETRIIAIPKNKEGLFSQEFLKVPYDLSTLSKIRVSSTLQDREEVIKDLRLFLESKNLREVKVI